MMPGLNSFESTIFLLAIILWIISEYVGAAIIPSLRRHGTKIKENDKGSSLVIIGGIIYFCYNCLLLRISQYCNTANMDFLYRIIFNGLWNHYKAVVNYITWSFLFSKCWHSKRTKSREKGIIQTGKTSFIHRIALNNNMDRSRITIVGSGYYNDFRI